MSPSPVFVIHHGALGDVVLAFPLFQALNNAGVEIHLLCQNHLGALARRFGLAHRIHALESAAFASLYLGAPESKAMEAVNACEAILAITRFSPLLSGISNRFKKPIYILSPRPEPGEPIHVSRHLLLSCIRSGLLGHGAHLPPVDTVSDLPSRRQTRIVWIHPGAGSPKKQGPLHLFIETAALLRKTGMDPAFLLGPAEACLKPALAERATAFRTVEVSTLEALTEAPQRGRALIGNDSGVSHLAAHLGLPTVALFGPTDPIQWKPLGPRVRVIHDALACSPCFGLANQTCTEIKCFDTITPHRILEALDRMDPLHSSLP